MTYIYVNFTSGKSSRNRNKKTNESTKSIINYKKFSSKHEKFFSRPIFSFLFYLFVYKEQTVAILK